jgi:hypothetical protein
VAALDVELRDDRAVDEELASSACSSSFCQGYD